METKPRPIAVYNSRGDVGAYLVYPFLYNPGGEWIGWITSNRSVFSVLGFYVGYITNDPRILRKRSTNTFHEKITPPSPPPRIAPPANAPLAPLMSELTYDKVDVLLECPEQLHTADSGELKEDMD